VTKWFLRIWWILSALVAVGLFARGEPVLGGLAVVNATAAFAGTAVIGRQELILAALARARAED